MPDESSLEVYRVISATVVPVVIISACGLLCLAFYNRLAVIVGRLRRFQTDRMVEQEAYARHRAKGQQDHIAQVRYERVLHLLDSQTRRVTRRAKLIQATLLCLLMTIACLTLCSVAIGAGTVLPETAYPALALELIGLGFLLAGVILAMLELRTALEPIKRKEQLVSELGKDLDELSSNGST